MMANSQSQRTQGEGRRWPRPLRRILWRWACLGGAWSLGSWIAIQSLHSQDFVAPGLVSIDTSPEFIPNRMAPTSILSPRPVTTSPDLSAAACHFWQTPTPGLDGRTSTAPLVKVPFRYGDFGAQSWPIRHQATGYYQSRKDWVWQ